MLEREDVRVGKKVHFVGQGDQFALARGAICEVRKNGRFDVSYDSPTNVREENCRPEDWVCL